MIRLPFLVLMAFRSAPARLRLVQVNRFVAELVALTLGDRRRVSIQLLEDAVKEHRNAITELSELGPSAVLTHTRQSINTARRSLDADTFQDYVTAMLRLHRTVVDSTPLWARMLGALHRDDATPVHETVRAELEAAQKPGSEHSFL